MDRLTEINAFITVVQAGSFSEAARQLHVSPTIISRHVRELETWLGVRLLNRTTRHIALTEIGHVVQARCLEVLAQFQRLEETADDWREAPRGKLRVVSPLLFGGTVLATRLPEFLASYPSIDVELTLTDRFVDLVEEGQDIAIALGDLPDSSAITRMLGQLHGGLYASPTYLDKRGRPTKIEDLLTHECILYASSGDSWTIIDKANKTHSLKVSGQLRTNSATVVAAGLIQGQGIGLVPDYMAREALKAGTLERVLPGCEPPTIAVRALYNPGRYQAAKLTVFLDFVASVFAVFSR